MKRLNFAFIVLTLLSACATDVAMPAELEEEKRKTDDPTLRILDAHAPLDLSGAVVVSATLDITSPGRVRVPYVVLERGQALAVRIPTRASEDYRWLLAATDDSMGEPMASWFEADPESPDHGEVVLAWETEHLPPGLYATLVEYEREHESSANAPRGECWIEANVRE